MLLALVFRHCQRDPAVMMLTPPSNVDCCREIPVPQVIRPKLQSQDWEWGRLISASIPTSHEFITCPSMGHAMMKPNIAILFIFMLSISALGATARVTYSRVGNCEHYNWRKDAF